MSQSKPASFFKAVGGFTLVELLVVVTIIVILIAILVPSLDRAMAQAQIAACASNHRQILTGHAQYLLNNRMMIPPSYNSDGNFGCNNFGDPAIYTAFPNSFGSLIPYAFGGGGRKVFNCPTTDIISRNDFSETNYFFNGSLSGKSSSSIARSSSVIYTSGWGYRTTNLYYRPFQSGNLYYTWAASAQKPSYNTHHLKGGNFGFGDAHVEYRKPLVDIMARDFGLTGGPGASGNSGDTVDGPSYLSEF